MDSRILIAVILSLAAVFAYQELVLKRLYPPEQEQQVASGQPSPKSLTSNSIASPSAAAPSAPVISTLSAPSNGAAAAVRTIEVRTDDYDARFTTRGARIESMLLSKFRETAAPHSPLLDLVTTPPGDELPLGLVLDRANGRFDDRNVAYSSDAPAKIVLHGDQQASIVFSAAVGDLRLAKRLTFTGNSYVMEVQGTAQDGALSGMGFTMAEPLTAHIGYYDIPEIQALVNNHAAVEGEKALRKGLAPLSGPITYAGFGDRYFLTVFLPQQPHQGSVEMHLGDTQARATLFFAVHGDQAAIRTQLYMGPKDLTLLEAVNSQLSRAIDFGWTGILALAFLRALKVFYHVAPNYGVDIILLTVAIRIVFLPLSIKSQRSMMRLQRLQPQVQRLRDKYADDKEKLNREMIDLYKRNHVNPLGGCAPMLLQLPIFIGLYEALLNAVELRHAPFIGWIRDLSAPECLPIPHFPTLPFVPCGGIPVLVLLMGASTWLQQRMTPQAADPNQQKMMMLMPLMFTIMFIQFPAGLTLYYFASNMLGIGQQYFLNREFQQLTPANP